jgi:adenosylcobinamide kinase/adenosylcobinamide-phosphate guanylyltransferase
MSDRFGEPVSKRLILLLGGARSGKSAYAENWARTHGRRVLYVATAEALDGEMRDRIAHHRASRPAAWRTLEAPRDVGRAIRERAAGESFDTLVLDCVTLLASNVLLALPEDANQAAVDAALRAEIDDLLAAYSAGNATWLVVSNEVGLGVVPPSRLGRLYRDALGRANQRLAAAADRVLLLVAGLPWELKPPGA